MVPKPLLQCYGIIIKNLSNHWTNKKRFFGEFIFPIIISSLYIVMQQQKQASPFVAIILGVLLKMQIALIGMSAIKQLVSLFLNQRQKQYRQYQIIFGLGSRCHTLSNLFYMGLYMSFFLVPFYLTLNYYHFDWHYIGVFAAFVISTMTSSMMLTSFFKDHKLATQFIGMFFSLSSFLVMMYSGGKQNQTGQIIYTPVDYLAMIVPNSSFAIAIMYERPSASLYSIWFIKIYLIIYSVMQFPHQWKQLTISCYNRIKRLLFGQIQNPNILTEDFNLNDQISENQTANGRINADPQNIMIKIKDLIKTYKIKQGQFNALNRINMTIYKRQIFGLLGRNGAGKTTLVDVLTNIQNSTSGSFFINFQKNQDQNLQKIGICYQHQILYEQLTVEQHLYFYCRIKNIMTDYTATIDSIVCMLRIRDQFKKKVKQLSGGNKRKLSIAIAVLGNPQLMIFDEPTSGLDPLSRRSVWQILQQLKKDFNCSIILTTHHLDEAQVLSDWICVIQKGTVIVQNSPDQIKTKYGNGYYLTLQFSSSIHLQKRLLQITSYLQKVIKRAQILQKQNNRAKLFLKFSDYSNKYLASNMPQQQNKSQQKLLLQILEWLNTLDDVKIQVQKNSLQQSFIAILKDPQNGIAANTSGDSIELANVIQRPLQPRKTLEQFQQQSIFYKIQLLFSQTFGVFLRCIYFHKGQVVTFFMTYNINIIIFLFAMLFNKFVTQVITKAATDSNGQIDGDAESVQQENSKQPNYSNNMLILQGYVIMAGAFIVIPMYQKEKNIRRVFNSRGVSTGAYWIGNFIFDFSYFLINLFIMKTFITPDSFIFLEKTDNGIYLFVWLGVGIILYAYTASAFFSKLTTANTWFSIINMLLGFILLPMIIVGSQTVLGYLSFLKYIYPYYDLNMIVMKETMKNASGGLIINSNQQNIDHTQYIWFSIVLYLLILIFVQIRLWDRIKQIFWLRTQIQSNENNIQLRNVCKKYGQIQALRNVNYSVGNQRLALLGHNGAGKSTTFGLLSGQLNPTSGKQFLEKRTKLNHEKIMRSAGVCYQQDCLWENTTPLQIFNIFSYLVPIQHSGEQIQWLFQSLQFEPMSFNKRFADLSGGNKRKICMGVSLYGDPIIRLLDECSTGLDPSSRVAMVQTLKHSGQGSTIFTTHSMSEAQTLCTKTVIMGKGEVLQFDYIYKLKQKYYNCYWIDVIFKTKETGATNSLQNSSFVQNNIELIKRQLKSIILQERYQQKGNKKGDLYKSLPKILKATKQQKMRLEFDRTIWPIHMALKTAYIFRDRLESLKQQQLIETIYISQPTLQDVYIRLTSQTQQNDEHNEQNVSKVYVIEDEEFEQETNNKNSPKSNKFSNSQKFYSQKKQIELMEI